MRKAYLSVVSAFMFCSAGIFAQTFIGQDASNKVKDAVQVIYSENVNKPTFIEFNASPANFRMALNNPVEAMNEVLGLKEHDALQRYKEEKDDIGFTHTRYRQLYKNIPVEGGEYIAHQKNGILNCINGYFYTIGDIAVTPSLSQDQAFAKALDFVGAKKYKWENKQEIATLKEELNDPSFNYDPHPELVIFPKGNKINDKADFRLAYKFTIYAELPESKADIFVDAQNGEIIGRHELLHFADVEGTAKTKYSGEQKIMTTQVGSNYVLRETGRGGGIKTYNANNAPETNQSYPSTDFTDSDNYWDNFNAKLDEAATDAHWATEMTYDYFKNKHGRNSIDNKGFTLINYVHCGTNWYNANWNGSFMRYGDGSNKMPLTAIDIGAHEMTHGVTSNSAKLIYQAESGALNESFSDIFGTCVEWMAKPNKGDWDIGGDIGALRSMQYPKSYSNPDTYKGEYWVNTGDVSENNDYGGVHTNSGVQNKWFYILCMGEQGVNDNNKSYVVKGIGMDKAAKIAFRTLTVLLTSSSDYANTRTNSLKAATDLYGSCSPEYVAVAYAWDAVGVTGTFTCNVGPTAGFISSFADRCNGSIQFTDISLGTPTGYLWDFGDGQTSTDKNPLHTYTSSGKYTVKLIAKNSNGSDTTIKADYIEIELPKGPTAKSAARCGAGVVNLSATSTTGGDVKWFDAATNGTVVNTGTTYSPDLTATTTYYLENTIDLTPKKVGAADSSILDRGGMFTANYIHGLFFDVLAPLTLKSVKVYAGSAGDRIINLVDIHGELLLTKTVTIPKGESRVTLDFDLPVGTQYFLKVAGTLLDLQRARGGATFPYTIAGLISITGSDVEATVPGTYYFFYDWEVVKSGCIGPRTPVTGEIYQEIEKPTITESQSHKVLTATPSGAGYTYQWFLDGTEIAGATNESYTPSKDGSYTVKVKNAGDCSGTSDPYNFKVDGISINKLDGVKIYPNPANEQLTIDVPANNNNVTVFIYSVIGKLVYKEAFANNGQPHIMNLNGIDANGVYFIKIQSGTDLITRKFNLNR